MSLNDISKDKGKSEITLKGRREMTLFGVEEVVNFDEEGAKLKTVDGELFIEGNEIKIGTLDTERGVVSLSGKINGFYYSSDAEKSKKGFWGRLTR